MRLRAKKNYVFMVFLWIAIIGMIASYSYAVMGAGSKDKEKIGLLIIGHGYFDQDQKFYDFVDEVQKRLLDYPVDSGLHMVMDMETRKMWQTEDEAIRRLESQRVKKINPKSRI